MTVGQFKSNSKGDQCRRGLIQKKQVTANCGSVRRSDMERRDHEWYFEQQSTRIRKSTLLL